MPVRKKKVGENIRSAKKKQSAKIWSVKNLVTCPKFRHFLPTFFLPIRYDNNVYTNYVNNNLINQPT